MRDLAGYQVQTGEQQIPPLRFAPVGMTDLFWRTFTLRKDSKSDQRAWFLGVFFLTRQLRRIDWHGRRQYVVVLLSKVRRKTRAVGPGFVFDKKLV
jgi:hypothetical protein